MAILPEGVRESDLSRKIAAAGLKRIHRGKVRDTYALPDTELLLVVATDRVSIFDFVLPAVVEDKGAILTAMTVFWLEDVFDHTKHHLVASGKRINEYLPPALRGTAELHARALVVQKLKMLVMECVVRRYLTGSGWRDYQATGRVCGHVLPPRLHDGSKLPEPIFTPATKAEVGHDKNFDAAFADRTHGPWPGLLSLHLFQQGFDYALKRGIILADTKFEFGMNRVLADEVLTPDSSRFWLQEQWATAANRGTSPPSHDKEFVRQWGKTVLTPFHNGKRPITGLGNLDPASDEHLAFVQSVKVPEQVLFETTVLYHGIFERLTGMELADFQKMKLGISA